MQKEPTKTWNQKNSINNTFLLPVQRTGIRNHLVLYEFLVIPIPPSRSIRPVSPLLLISDQTASISEPVRSVIHPSSLHPVASHRIASPSIDNQLSNCGRRRDALTTTRSASRRLLLLLRLFVSSLFASLPLSLPRTLRLLLSSPSTGYVMMFNILWFCFCVCMSVCLCTQRREGGVVFISISIYRVWALVLLLLEGWV